MHIADIQTKRPTAFPAYFLGRPADVYRRRYRRVLAPITLRP